MVNINQAFPSKYLSAGDLDGRDHTLTITGYQPETIENDVKYIVYFKGAKKGLVLNKTNARAIAGIYGSEMDNWVGKQITIGTAWVDFRGDQVEAIRVRPQLRQNGLPPADGAPDGGSTLAGDLADEIPF